MYSLTYNFNFFWEDSYIIGSYNIVVHDPDKYTFPKLLLLFLDTIIAPEQFYGIAYGWKPIQEEFIYLFTTSLFGINVLTYRILRAALFAALITLSTSFLLRGLYPKIYFDNEPELQTKNTLFSPTTLVIIFISYFAVLPEIWAATLYGPDTLLLTLFFSVIALALFLFFYNNDAIQNTWIVSLVFFGIIVFTELSILTKHVGRINFLIIFLFLCFTDYKKLLKPRYFMLILLLFCLSFPILGITRVFDGESLPTILGISGHLTNNTGETGIFETALRFFSTAHLAFIPHAYFLIAAFVFFLALQLFCLYTKREAHVVPTSLKELVIFSGIWFVFSAFIFFIARGFVFDPMHFLRFEFSVFLIPQTLFLISYCLFIIYRYFPDSKKLLCILILFLLLATAHNALRLNEWRGGWGAYFLGYDTVRQYVDDHAENALLVLPYNHASPLYFINSTNNYVLEPDITNTTLLHSYADNYSTVFIASTDYLFYNDPTIVNIQNLTIRDTSLYGMVKKAIMRYYPTPMYIYKATKT